MQSTESYKGYIAMATYVLYKSCRHLACCNLCARIFSSEYLEDEKGRKGGGAQGDARIAAGGGHSGASNAEAAGGDISLP